MSPACGSQRTQLRGAASIHIGEVADLITVICRDWGVNGKRRDANQARAIITSSKREDNEHLVRLSEETLPARRPPSSITGGVTGIIRSHGMGCQREPAR